MSKWLHFLVLLACLVALGSCKSAPATSCKGPQDCSDGKQCREGFCVYPCATHADCSKDLRCLEGICQLCRSDADCDGGELCVAGLCSCPSPRKECGGSCVDIKASSAHCGACQKACPQGQICTNGRCHHCPLERPTPCPNSCVALTKDPKHCGSCGNACKPGQLCHNGRCRCPVGLTSCGGICAKLDQDSRHCGACQKSCRSNERCADGRCIVESCQDHRKSLTECQGACVELSSNPLHCGTCSTEKSEHACSGGRVCQNGRCACAAGFTPCTEKGGERCASLSSSWSHCGTCGNQCGEGSLCVQGRCVQKCPKDTPTPCLGTCASLLSNDQHCGACGQACRSDQRCVGGRCACKPGLLACGDACVDPRTHDLHCGGCYRRCLRGKRCSEGECVKSCPDQTKISCAGGCHDKNSSPLHCGGCNKPCLGGTSCKGGQCTCPSGLTLCGGLCVDLQADPQHCGRCGALCPKDQSCSGGACKTTCSAQTPLLCLGGCIQPKTNPRHCGACNHPCGPGQRCTDGKCSCPQGTSLCLGQCLDLSNNRLHCGACHRACNPGQICQRGSCICAPSREGSCLQRGPSCTGDGITLQRRPECFICADHQTDDDHCGGCRKACGPQQTCQAGKCMCPGNLTDCSGACVETRSDPKHCGACGRLCPEGSRCDQGECVFACLQGKSFCRDAKDPTVGLCVDLKADPAHCGGCRQPCDAGQRCSNGTCCGPGQTTCASKGPCVDLRTSSDHCGACGNRCEGDQVCLLGRCVECTDASHCKDGKLCIQNTCMACRKNADCPPGLRCDVQKGTCGSCKDHYDCPIGLICLGGSCLGCLSDGKGGSNCPNKLPCVNRRCQPQASVVAGSCSGGAGFRDGAAAQALFAAPEGLALDTKGHLYIADVGNHCIRKLDKNGAVSTFAGKCQQSGFVKGSAATARFSSPRRLSFTPAHPQRLYVVDGGNHCLRTLDLSSTPLLVKEHAAFPCTAGKDSPILGALAWDPTSKKLLMTGKHAPSSGVDVVALFEILDGKAARLLRKSDDTPAAFLQLSTALLFVGGKLLWVTSDGVDDRGQYQTNRCLHELSPFSSGAPMKLFSGCAIPQPIAGPNTPSYHPPHDGARLKARYSRIASLAKTRAGELFISDYDNAVIRLLNFRDEVSTFAGKYTQDPATKQPIGGIALDKDPLKNRYDGVGELYVSPQQPGILYIADSNNHCIRMIRFK